MKRIIALVIMCFVMLYPLWSFLIDGQWKSIHFIVAISQVAGYVSAFGLLPLINRRLENSDEIAKGLNWGWFIATVMNLLLVGNRTILQMCQMKY